MRKLYIILLMVAAVLTACTPSKKDRPKYISVSGVQLDRQSVDLWPGATLQLRATVTPSDATIQSVSWSSSKPAVAQVEQDGMVSALSLGDAVITVKTADGEFTASCSVSVKNPKYKITVDAPNLDNPPYLAKGGTTQLSAQVTGSSGAVLQWSSTNEQVATVSSTGLVTGISAGSAEIYASATEGGSVCIPYALQVVDRLLEATAVSFPQTTDMYAGNEYPFTIVTTPATAHIFRIESITSSNPSAISVANYSPTSREFRLKANKKGGTADITVTLTNGVSRTVNMGVVDIQWLLSRSVYIFNNPLSGGTQHSYAVRIHPGDEITLPAAQLLHSAAGNVEYHLVTSGTWSYKGLEDHLLDSEFTPAQFQSGTTKYWTIQACVTADNGVKVGTPPKSTAYDCFRTIPGENRAQTILVAQAPDHPELSVTLPVFLYYWPTQAVESIEAKIGTSSYHLLNWKDGYNTDSFATSYKITKSSGFVSGCYPSTPADPDHLELNLQALNDSFVGQTGILYLQFQGGADDISDHYTTKTREVQVKVKFYK